MQKKHTTFVAKKNHFIPLQIQQKDTEIQTGYVVAEQTMAEGKTKGSPKLLIIINQYLTT
jgi:hypothetical protein